MTFRNALTLSRRFIAGAIVSFLTLAALTGCVAPADTGTFTIWMTSSPASAEGTAWNSAVEAFRTAHPRLNVDVVQKDPHTLEASGNSNLQGAATPDVAEWQKGVATGSASSSNLLTDLGAYSSKYGWEKLLPSSFLQVGQYSSGKMGAGTLYGVPSNVGFVSFYYNADLLAAAGINPASLTHISALTAAFDKFVQSGVTPLASADYLLTYVSYSLSLNGADRAWINAYQFQDGAAVNFNDARFTTASETLKLWSDKKYFGPPLTAASVSATDAVSAFVSGKTPFLFAGSELDNDITALATFRWGKFLAPGNSFSVGSPGNLWVIPVAGTKKDLAAEFINLTLQHAAQNVLAQGGGGAIAAEPTAVTSPLALKNLPLISTLLKTNAVAFYPDWPASGYEPVLVNAARDLVAGKITPAQYRSLIGDYYAQKVRK